MRVITNSEERNKILRCIHDGLGSSDESAALAGHIGRDKAVAKILERYVVLLIIMLIIFSIAIMFSVINWKLTCC